MLRCSCRFPLALVFTVCFRPGDKLSQFVQRTRHIDPTHVVVAAPFCFEVMERVFQVVLDAPQFFKVVVRHNSGRPDPAANSCRATSDIANVLSRITLYTVSPCQE